jgi:hypothetical protein
MGNTRDMQPNNGTIESGVILLCWQEITVWELWGWKHFDGFFLSCRNSKFPILRKCPPKFSIKFSLFKWIHSHQTPLNYLLTSGADLIQA